MFQSGLFQNLPCNWRLSPGIVVGAFLFLVNITFVLLNKSLIFNYDILNKFGDQHLYIGLSNNLLNFNFVPHIYSVGYSIFLLPFLIALKTTEWTVISRYVVAFQAFIIVPLTWIILLSMFGNTLCDKKLSKFFCVLIAVLFISYELVILRYSDDGIVFHLFFGLIPYSEPLGILVLVLIYFIMINNNIGLNGFLALFLGVLISFAVSIRVVFLILVLPVFLYVIFLYFAKHIKKICIIYFIVGLLVGYMPQLIYNYGAYHKLIVSGYKWNWEIVAPRYAGAIRDIYGKDITELFSRHYLAVNISGLIKHYIHFLLISLINILFLLLYRAGNFKLDKKAAVFLLGNLCSILYIVVYLSYWWSAATGLIDRFLMPLTILSLINLYCATCLRRDKSTGTV